MANRGKFVGVVDRISGLPDEILCHILSFLPIQDAFRTSILSSRWMHLFASISTLDFLDLPFTDDDTKNQFKNFVDRLMLSATRVGLECFRLGFDLPWRNDRARLCGWICAVLCRGVKELVLESLEYADLPTHIFSSQSLVTLKLRRPGDILVPTDVRLPNLKTLHLYEFGWSTDVSRLISGCVVLEELVMMARRQIENRLSEIDIDNTSLKRLVLDVRCLRKGFEYVVKVNAPSLVYFEYFDTVANTYAISNNQCLEKAYIKIIPPNHASYNNLIHRGATHLLRAIGSVRSLCLNIRLVETLSTTPLERVLAFPNLVELVFHNDGSAWQGTNLVEFLHCVPILETLILDMPTFPEACREVPKTAVPYCLLFHLKEIKISYIIGGEHLFNLISYFLKNALVLEKLIISGSRYASPPSTSILTQKLLSLPKELSRKCQLG